MENALHFTITPFWAVIEHIRKKILAKLEGAISKEDMDDILICAVELAENAVKYGESVPNKENIQFRLENNDGLVELKVSNGVVKQADMKNAISTIDAINSGRDPSELYFDRLDALHRDPSIRKSQLGLYRIASETKFKLAYDANQNDLTVIARRKISPRES